MPVNEWTAVQVTHAKGQGPWLVVCEHASAFIPAEFDHLGLDLQARASHVAWDIGALDVAVALSRQLDAPLIAGGISRLVYDCNRPASAPDCIPARSEIHDIPGNAGLTQADRSDRFDRVHTPFHDAVDAEIDAHRPAMLITIHSFTPVYNGVPRDLDLGFLYHSDGAAAHKLMAAVKNDSAYKCALNEPYGPQDGVTYMLEKHGDANGLPSVMIEIRNDLIDTADKAQEMAAHLSRALIAAFPDLSGGPAR